MARTIGNQNPDLGALLRSHPRSLRFQQAVRVLEAFGSNQAPPQAPVGWDHHPGGEAVRFLSAPSLTFPGTELHSLKLSPAGGPATPARMAVSFMGLVGSAGVLPQHYTSLIIERQQLKDSSLRDLLDLFQHRVISLFYRASLKYRFPFEDERARRFGQEEGSFTRSVFSLVGLGLPSLRERGSMEDQAFALEAGHFARSVRTAQGLERALRDQFGVAARVEEFVGQWLEIPDEERTALPNSFAFGDHRVCLGGGATLGSKVWDVASSVRLHLGPVRYDRFLALGPGGREHAALCSFVRSYLDLGLEYDIQLVLAKGESLGTRLAATGSQGPCQLGRNAWLEYDAQHTGLRKGRFPGRPLTGHG